MLINILFRFYYSIFDLLRIEFHIFFIYGASGSWPGSWVWEINTDQYFFLLIFFFNFIVWHYFFLKDWFVLFFNFFSIRSGLGHRFCGLNMLAHCSLPWLHVYHDILGWLGLIVFVFFLIQINVSKGFFFQVIMTTFPWFIYINYSRSIELKNTSKKPAYLIFLRKQIYNHDRAWIK